MNLPLPTYDLHLEAANARLSDLRKQAAQHRLARQARQAARQTG